MIFLSNTRNEGSAAVDTEVTNDKFLSKLVVCLAQYGKNAFSESIAAQWVLGS